MSSPVFCPLTMLNQENMLQEEFIETFYDSFYMFLAPTFISRNSLSFFYAF